MYNEKKILVGKSGDEKIYIYPKMANRHGLIAGATGTGKTVTLKVLAESFSDCGVPVFLADVKGDLAGMCNKGVMNDNLAGRIEKLGLNEYGFDFDSFPTTFWDIYAEKGIPLRTTVSEMGPLLLARILGLNDTQSDILTILFKIADDNGLLLIDTKDIKALIQYVGECTEELSLQYGNITKQSLGVITRSIIALEGEGGEQFFAEPALNLADWFSRDRDGKGMINVLDCQKLINNPNMYATFLLWMMSELFELLPEAGDLDAPKMVFFFDEAHLLFENASKQLLTKIEQVVKLIRSKGVGIYFITQSPSDVPDGVLAQLGNKIQHALHAYTPAEQKAVKAAALSFRENPEFKTYDELQNLGIGEALISVLDEDGIPTIVKKAKILPPQSQMGALSESERESQVKNNMLYIRYNNYVDNDSAYEFIMRRIAADEEEAQRLAEEAAREREEAELAKQQAKEQAELEKQQAKEQAAKERQEERERAAELRQQERERAAELRQQEREKIAEEKARAKALADIEKQKAKEAAAKEREKNRIKKSVSSTVGSTVGREIGKSLGGSSAFGKRLGGNVGSSLGRNLFGTFFSK